MSPPEHATNATESSSSPERLASFAAFWPYYLGEHRQPRCRALHFWGTTSAMVVIVASLLREQASLLPLALLAGYGPAWAGHFFVEHNRPATFRYPLWSLLADFKMWGLMLRGRLWSGDPRVELSLPTTD